MKSRHSNFKNYSFSIYMYHNFCNLGNLIVKIFCGHQRLRKLNTPNVSTTEDQNIQYFQYYITRQFFSNGCFPHSAINIHVVASNAARSLQLLHVRLSQRYEQLNASNFFIFYPGLQKNFNKEILHTNVYL